MPVNGPGFVLGFVTVNVMMLVPPATMLVGLKLFVTVGGSYTVRFAVFEGVPAVGVSLVVTPLVWSGFTPGVLEVT